MLFNMTSRNKVVSVGGVTSGSLSYIVVGATSAPANPSVNIIWVNTDVEVTGYAFSEIAPDAVSGFVWIRTDDYRDVKFNALAENALYVYPGETKQYIDGVWVRKDAWLCGSTGREQFSFDHYYIYDDGDVTKATGGWTQTNDNYARGSSSVGTTLYLQATQPSASASTGKVYLTTNNSIDVTNYSTLHILWGDCSYSRGSGSYDTRSSAFYGIQNNTSDLISNVSNSAPSGTTIIDISSLSSLKLRFYAGTNYYGLSGTHMTLNIKRIWLE